MASPVQQCFSVLHKKWHDFQKKKIFNKKSVFWLSLQFLPEKFLILRGIRRDITIKVYDILYLLTAIGLSPGGSTHLHTNNTENNTNNNRTTQITNNVEECGPCHVFASFTLAFALQLRKKHGKTSVRVIKTSVTVQCTYYQKKNPHTTKLSQTHTLQNQHIQTHAYTFQAHRPTILNRYRGKGGISTVILTN